MAKIYALSDIHGYYDELLTALQVVDLASDPQNQLILLGDYVNRGPQGYQALAKVKQLAQERPTQVVVLAGNHEEMLADWFTEQDDALAVLLNVGGFQTIQSFFPGTAFAEVQQASQSLGRDLQKISDFLREQIMAQHAELVDWLLQLVQARPQYYETANQIFVHAGILEVPELWRTGTDERDFRWKYPAETGAFYKDIIAGHVGSAEVAGDAAFLGKVYWDRQNHFYLDGTVPRSRRIPVLCYDTATRRYSSFEPVAGSWRNYDLGASKTTD